MDLFMYNGTEVALNKPELILVPEFKAIWNDKRNKSTEDKKGEKKAWAYKVFTFIYLMYDWQSPYAEYEDSERKEVILEEQGLSNKEINTTEVKAAVEKYLVMQRSLKLELLLSAKRAARELILFFNTVSLTRTDELTGKYLVNAKDVINNLQTVGKAVEGIDELINQVKKEREGGKSFRGGSKPGTFDLMSNLDDLL